MMKTRTLALSLCAFAVTATVAFAQTAIIIDLGGTYVGIVLNDDGSVMAVKNVVLVSAKPGPSVNPYVAPPQEQRAAVEPIAKIRLSSGHSASLAKIFSDEANVVKTNLARIAAGVSPEVGTTSQVQQQLKAAITGLGIEGKYAGLSDAVDSALASLIGRAPRGIEARDQAALLAVAWAMWEGGHRQ